MAISFGGIGIMSLRLPFSHFLTLILNKGDLRSLFCLLVFSIVFLVLAYLTNPSENSFRSYLTEQSFRQHLRRLDDTVDDDHSSQSRSSTSTPSSARNTLPFDNRSPFHFANRASVSLRTPKHAFHSFGLFTIAAIVPSSKADQRRPDHRNDGDSLMITDSWFIGAFGRWWRGGILEAWYQDVISRSNDEESWSSGILGMKTLDRVHEFNALPGLPFSTRSLPPHGLSRGSPPRLRNREKTSQRLGSFSVRSATPPPLPKSASLPLHASRSPQTQNENNDSQPPLHSQPQSSEVNLSSPVVPPAPALFDQSPHVIDLLRQISLSKASVLDLRTQLADCQSAASQSHATLQSELETHRDRKRQEDAAFKELKLRTKTLDDQKRSAEGTRRDMEKRLKVVQYARDDATQRMEYLDKEIEKLQDRIRDDQASLRQMQDSLPEGEQEIKTALERKRKEITVAEDVVSALNIRARDLEECLAAEKERLRSIRGDAERRKQRALQIAAGTRQASWPPVVFKQDTASIAVAFPSHDPPEFASDSGVLGKSAALQEVTSARPTKLSLGSLSNFSNSTSMNPLPILHTNGFPMFEDDMHPSQRLSSRFAPFSDPPATPSSGTAISPMSTSLIPTGLITSLDIADNLSMSFRSESDVRMDRDWRKQGTGSDPSLLSSLRDRSPGYTPITSSPVSLHGPSAASSDRDPFEIRSLSGREHELYSLHSDNRMDVQRISVPHRHNSDPNSSSVYGSHDSVTDPLPFLTDKSSSRHWYSVLTDHPKKGLNPDAKVFSFGRGASKPVGRGAYDALNPNGLGSGMVLSAAADSSSLLRAFAPSPAEREVLQRALGGSTNASLERLPSLSDVGSIPPSPSHVHAHATQPMSKGTGIPSWLQTLPRFRKSNFSPWDDEEPSSVGNNVLSRGGMDMEH